MAHPYRPLRFLRSDGDVFGAEHVAPRVERDDAGWNGLVRFTAALSQRVARERVTLQHLVGRRWVNVGAAATSSVRKASLLTRVPKTVGYSYYRVVKATSAASLGSISPAVCIRVMK